MTQKQATAKAAWVTFESLQYLDSGLDYGLTALPNY